MHHPGRGQPYHSYGARGTWLHAPREQRFGIGHGDRSRSGEVVHPRLKVAAGGSTSYQVALDARPTGDVTVTIRVSGMNGEGGAAPAPNLSPPGTSPWDGANTMEGRAAIRAHPATLTFTPTKWDLEQPVTLTVAEEGDLISAAITLAHTTTGGGHVNVSSTMTRTVVAAHSSEETKSWHLRVGRTVSHQVVTALEECWSTPNAAGLQLTVRGSPSPALPRWRNRKGCLPRPWALRPSPPKRWWRAPPSGWRQSQREERRTWLLGRLLTFQWRTGNSLPEWGR